MAMVLPGVSFNETLIVQESSDDPVTMPLFLGYVQRGDTSNPVTAMQLMRVESLTHALASFGESGTLSYSLRHFFDNGGQVAYVLPLGIREGETTDHIQTLIKVLQSPDLLAVLQADSNTGLLLAPEFSELNDVDFTSNPALQAELWLKGWKAVLSLCCQSQRRFALLELPEVPEVAMNLSKEVVGGESNQHAAAWWPRLQTRYLSHKNAFMLLSPLPAVAAAIQRNARENGVWKAPANMLLTKTLRPTRDIQTSLGLLNNDGMSGNLIRSFVGQGVKLWGCRTLLNDPDSPWQYIQTRLLVNSVEHYLSQLSRAYLYEPNNALTWMKLKGQVWTWLRQQWLNGAFYGTVEEEAFSLSIGLNETMSETDIRNGKMVLSLSLALLAPAEFIDISLTLDLRVASIITQSGEEHDDAQ